MNKDYFFKFGRYLNSNFTRYTFNSFFDKEIINDVTRYSMFDTIEVEKNGMLFHLKFRFEDSNIEEKSFSVSVWFTGLSSISRNDIDKLSFDVWMELVKYSSIFNKLFKDGSFSELEERLNSLGYQFVNHYHKTFIFDLNKNYHKINKENEFIKRFVRIDFEEDLRTFEIRSIGVGDNFNLSHFKATVRSIVSSFIDKQTDYKEI